MSYDEILSGDNDETLPLRREMVLDDARFAQMILDVTEKSGFPRPDSVANPQTVRANLGEFCVWELGSEHWQLFSKKLCLPANKDPWRASSDPGVDILATDEEVSLLMVIEVKSSQDDGSDLVNDQSKGLKGDFRSLFEGDGRTRLKTRVLDLQYEFRFRFERVDLAEKVASLVGDSPSSSPDVRLVGVLVCSNEQAQERRKRAFGRLHTWLVEDQGHDDEKWQAHQCRYFVIELSSLSNWIGHLLP